VGKFKAIPGTKTFFFKIYISDFRGAAEIRKELMETNSFEEARHVIKNKSQF